MGMANLTIISSPNILPTELSLITASRMDKWHNYNVSFVKIMKNGDSITIFTDVFIANEKIM